MNQDKPEKTDKKCNVCDIGVVEVGSAWSQCSNKNCMTRDSDNNLGTGASMEEQRDYWIERARDAESELDDALTHSEIREAALSAFEDYICAISREDAETAEIRADTYLSHLDKGWGWLKEESDEW